MLNHSNTNTETDKKKLKPRSRSQRSELKPRMVNIKNTKRFLWVTEKNLDNMVLIAIKKTTEH